MYSQENYFLKDKEANSWDHIHAVGYAVENLIKHNVKAYDSDLGIVVCLPLNWRSKNYLEEVVRIINKKYNTSFKVNETVVM